LDQVSQTGRARGAASAGVLDDRPEMAASSAGVASVSGLASEEEGAASTSTFKFGSDLPGGAELNDDQVQRLEKLRRNVSLDSSSLPQDGGNEGGKNTAPVIEHWKAT